MEPAPVCLQAKDCMLFAGTGIASGACIGVVNSIGMDTEIGKIQEQIQVHPYRMLRMPRRCVVHSNVAAEALWPPAPGKVLQRPAGPLDAACPFQLFSVSWLPAACCLWPAHFPADCLASARPACLLSCLLLPTTSL